MDNLKLFLAFCILVIVAGLFCTYDVKHQKEQIKNPAAIEQPASDISIINTNTNVQPIAQKQEEPIQINKEQPTASPAANELDDIVIEKDTIYIPPIKNENPNKVNQSASNNQIMPPLSEEERKRLAEKRIQEIERRVKEEEEKRIREQQKIYDAMEPLPVVLRCDEWDCTLSPDKLTMKYGKAGAYSNAVATRHYKKGKYYFEVEFKTLPNAKSTAFTNIGIAADKGYRFCNLNYVDDKQKPDRCPAYGIFRFATKLYDGDIIGVAIDLDNGKMTYSINDTWNVGMPSNMPDGILFQKGYEYTAAFQAGRNTYFNVNFGAKPFRYKIPKGYKAYN